MIQATFSLPSAPTRSNLLARAAIALSVTFLALLALLHFLEPEFDPSWRMISEYELGRSGWLMTIAFFAWGGSVLTLTTAVSPSLNTTGGTVGHWWMLLIGVALFAAGIFEPYPITNPSPTVTSTLHNLSGVIVIMTFPIAASLVARSLAHHPNWKSASRPLLWVTLLAWFGMVVFFASIPVSNIINPGAGRVGPQVFVGWPNRFLVLAYQLWLIFVGQKAASIAKR
jgi:uncharacterized protein DUF998